MLSVLTPTGARPEAFAACVKMMRAQTINSARWVIVDDGPEAMPTPQINGWEVIHIRPSPLWEPGQNTLGRNILAGLEHCGDRVAIVEDDDEYAPVWLDVVNGLLDVADLVGESHSLYVNKRTGESRNMGNTSHASLCSTAAKGSAIDHLRKAAETRSTMIDVRLWRSFDGVKALHRPDPRMVTGIKGWPGRPGIGVGHRI